MTDARRLQQAGILPQAEDLTWTDERSLQETLPKLQDRGWITPFQSRLILAGRDGELRVGNYVILDRIGEGGMGQVFLARKVSDPAARVVLKTILAGTQQRQDREARLLMSLRHSCIVPAIDYFTESNSRDGERSWLVMQWLAGPDLAAWSRQHGPAGRDRELTRKVVRWMWQAARGLAAAHEVGIIHRDIKPSNLILDEKQNVKVADFGIARHLASELSLQMTATGQLLGTTDFMAPEQAKSASKVDRRADLYSLGCSLFFLLEGQSPYRASDPVSMLVQHAEAPPPKLTHIANRFDRDWLSRLIHWLLAKDPQDRPRDAHEAASFLKGFVSGRYRLPILTRRRWIASASGLATACAAGVASWPVQEVIKDYGTALNSGEQGIEDRPSDKTLTDRVQGLVTQPISIDSGLPWHLWTMFPEACDYLEIDPAGELLAVLRADHVRIIDPVSSRTIHWIDLRGRLGRELSWSYDSSYLIVTLDDTTAILFDMHSENVQPIELDEPVEFGGNIAMHPNRDLASFSLKGGGVLLFSPKDRRQSKYASPQSQNLVWSLDGSKLAAAVGKEGLVLWDLERGDDGSLRRLGQYKYESGVTAVAWRPSAEAATPANLTACLDSFEVWEIAEDGKLRGETPLVKDLRWQRVRMRWSRTGESLIADTNFLARHTFKVTAFSTTPSLIAARRFDLSQYDPAGGIVLPQNTSRISAMYRDLEGTSVRHGWPIPKESTLNWPDNICGPLSLTWTSDGKQLLVVSPHGGLQIFDSRGIRIGVGLADTAGYACHVEYYNQSQSVVIDWHGGVHQVDLRTGVVKYSRSTSDEPSAACAAVDSRGRWVVVACSLSGNLLKHDLVDGNVIVLMEKVGNVQSLIASGKGESFFCGLLKGKVIRLDLDGKVLDEWVTPSGQHTRLAPSYQSDYPLAIANNRPCQLQANGKFIQISDTKGDWISQNPTNGKLAIAGRREFTVQEETGKKHSIPVWGAVAPVWRPGSEQIAMILEDGAVAVYDNSERRFVWTMLTLGPKKTLTFDAKGVLLSGNTQWLEECLVVVGPDSHGRSQCIPAREFYLADRPWESNQKVV